jgi:hypothetical protein
MLEGMHACGCHACERACLHACSVCCGITTGADLPLLVGTWMTSPSSANGCSEGSRNVIKQCQICTHGSVGTMRNTHALLEKGYGLTGL